MNLHATWTILASLVGCVHVRAEVEQRFEHGEHQGLRYRFELPAGATAENKRPLVVFLHGGGERGNDNRAQLSIEAFAQSAALFGPDTQRHERVLIVAPQCPKGQWWYDFRRLSQKNGATTFGVTESLLKVEALIDHLIATQAVDPKRILLVGISMGGFAAFDLMARRPGFYHSALIAAAGTEITPVTGIAKSRIYLMHGADDSSVPAALARKTAGVLREANSTVIYDEVVGAGHNVWTEGFSRTAVVRWLYGDSSASP